MLLLMTRLPELFTKEEKMQAWNDFEPLCLHDSILMVLTDTRDTLIAAQTVYM